MSSTPPAVVATVMTRGDDTEQRYAVVEVSLPARTTLPHHVHRREDVHLLVLAGQLSVDADRARMHLMPGDDAHLTAGRPWRLRAERPTRLLCLLVPAGAEQLIAPMLADGLADDRLALLAAAGIDLVPAPATPIEEHR